jgi:hypothetical protein
MAGAIGATLDQAGCALSSALHKPYSASGSGSGKPIKKGDGNAIYYRDIANRRHCARDRHRNLAEGPRRPDRTTDEIGNQKAGPAQRLQFNIITRAWPRLRKNT